MMEKWLTPSQVAAALGISTASARELMRTKKIRSTCHAKTSDGRRYYRTTASAVADYQQACLSPAQESEQRSAATQPILPRQRGTIYVP